MRSAGSDEMAPGARVRGLLSRLPSRCEPSLQSSSFYGLPECELLLESFSVAARYG